MGIGRLDHLGRRLNMIFFPLVTGVWAKERMTIEYRINHPISTAQFISLLADSTLGERRPIEDRECMEGMIANSNLTISAWDSGRLVGISRCMTDFHYACYLSDLAVSKAHQKKGIGKKLQMLTQEQLGPRCKLILIAAPGANSYYKHIGYSNNPRCWVLERGEAIQG
jgi:GNAT superfamily N-acetyltransferase